MTLVVNFYGGPGSGKSTAMAALFAELKQKGINCEMAPEFAKEKVWENSLDLLENQIYVFGKQLHALHRIKNKVSVIITDAPLLNSLIYGKHESPEFHALVKEVFSRFNNYNIFLERSKEYNPSGRLQTELDAKKLDDQIKEMLISGEYYFDIVNLKNTHIANLATEILFKLMI